MPEGQGMVPAPKIPGFNIRQGEGAVLLQSSLCRAVRNAYFSDFRRLIPSNFSMYFS
jgi:hypothetical protein